eukprot:360137-Chlamydomonas_euryale.AAC.4
MVSHEPQRGAHSRRVPVAHAVRSGRQVAGAHAGLDSYEKRAQATQAPPSASRSHGVILQSHSDRERVDSVKRPLGRLSRPLAVRSWTLRLRGWSHSRKQNVAHRDTLYLKHCCVRVYVRVEQRVAFDLRRA